MVNIYEIKAKLSQYVDAALRGEQVVICKRNQPVIELRALAQTRTEPRPLGLGKGLITVPASFFDSMPDEWLAEFEAKPVFSHPRERPSRIAEPPAQYVAPKKPRGRRRS